MSTLLDKCNELRTLAAMLVVRDLPEVASLVRESADIIWQLRDDLQQAQAENAKLRELMRVMAYCNQFRRDCDGCSMNDAAGIITERAGCDELLTRLRKMGIEVDDA